MRSPTRHLEHLDPDIDDLDGLDLATIDLTTAPWGSSSTANPVAFDQRTFEERYAELGFGLGVAPRRQHRDDAWWESPVGMIAVVVAVLLLLALST